jgi:hypothetical protein
MFRSSFNERWGFSSAPFKGTVATRPESTAFGQVKQIWRRARDGFEFLVSEFNVGN